MNQQQNAISLARVSAVSLVGESQALNLVKHRKDLIIILLTFISVVMFGCGSNSGIPAEIFLQRSESSKSNDSLLVSSYQNEYLDTALIWLDVAKSMKRDSPCYVLMQDYDTVVKVRGPNGIKVSFDYTVLPSDTGIGIPIWASSGVAFDTSRHGFICYSIDYHLYQKILNRIRSTARSHPEKLIHQQRIQMRRNLLINNNVDTSQEQNPDGPNLIDQIIGKTK